MANPTQTDKLDFKAALNAVKNGHIDNLDPNYDHLDTLEIALRLASRLQSGDISDSSLEAVGAMNNYDHEHGQDYTRADQDHKEWFKAMATQMIAEEVMTETVTISKKEYENLLSSQAFLNALEDAGVAEHAKIKGEG